jgi:transcriptional regulator with XRE-family HTH domain
MTTLGRKPVSLVGTFLRQKRETLSLSQRQLGMKFEPPVTTQFISNLERGVTPLPPHHVPTLARELRIEESELLALLEREYAQKINDRIHRPSQERAAEPAPAGGGIVTSTTLRNLVVEEKDAEFIRAVYQAYSLSDRETKENFVSVCQKILRMTK